MERKRAEEEARRQKEELIRRERYAAAQEARMIEEREKEEARQRRQMLEQSGVHREMKSLARYSREGRLHWTDDGNLELRFNPEIIEEERILPKNTNSDPDQYSYTRTPYYRQVKVSANLENGQINIQGQNLARYEWSNRQRVAEVVAEGYLESRWIKGRFGR